MNTYDMTNGQIAFFTLAFPILTFFFGMWLGDTLGGRMEKVVFQKIAVENNHAYYHPKTAQFTWNTNCIDKPSTP